MYKLYNSYSKPAVENISPKLELSIRDAKLFMRVVGERV